MHDHDQQHDHDNPVVRLRDDDDEHDNSAARLHWRVHVGRGAASKRVGHVGMGEEDGPVQLRVPVPTAND